MSSEDGLDDLKVKDLKAMLRAKKLKVGGSKGAAFLLCSHCLPSLYGRAVTLQSPSGRWEEG